MAAYFWASSDHFAKHFSSVPADHRHNSVSTDSHLIINDKGDDVRAWFPCPFCYVEIEVPVFCSHLQEEHCFNLKNAVCPICAANLGKDAIGHFIEQHAHSVKRRRKSKKSGIWSISTPMIGKELQELSTFMSSSSVGGRYSMHESVPDPLLSPFLCNASLLGSQENQREVESTRIPIPDDIQEQDHEERRQRAAFFQELIISTIF